MKKWTFGRLTNGSSIGATPLNELFEIDVGGIEDEAFGRRTAGIEGLARRLGLCGRRWNKRLIWRTNRTRKCCSWPSKSWVGSEELITFDVFGKLAIADPQALFKPGVNGLG